MATYSFDTITPAQALAITASDAVLFGPIAANQVTVLYNAIGTVTVTAAGRTVEFGPAFATLGANGRLVLSTEARLFVGDGGANLAPPSSLVRDDGLYGGGGEDTMDGGPGDDLLQGNTGADYLIGGGGREVMYGGQDNDRIVTTLELGDGVTLPADDGGDFAQGNRGDDIIEGGTGADTLLGGQGNDTIGGLQGGADFLNGNLGDDRIEGAGTLLGEGGADTLIGAGAAASSLFGGDGDDRITMAQGYVDAGVGNDRVDVRFGAGEAVVLGGDGADTLDAQLASQGLHVRFAGGEGQDNLLGSVGVDTLAGDGGADTIDGQGGRDVMTGGAGQDLFHVLNLERNGDGLPADPTSVLDWEAGDRLRFGFTGSAAGSTSNYREVTADTYAAAFEAARTAVTGEEPQYVAVQVGSDVVVFGFNGSSNPAAVILTGRSLADIAFGNFV